MKNELDISNNWSTLQRMLNRGLFESFIRHIRFPSLKNIDPEMRINFAHPITVLVGPNGTNKSTILRALEGCPERRDLGRYWFETDLDHIAEATRYIHGYRLPSGATAEVVKTRVNRVGRSEDYFETRAPLIRDGMARMPKMMRTPSEDRPFRNRTRWRPVSVPDVVYLDFRQEIPAHNISNYFDRAETPTERRNRESQGISRADQKKKLIRRRSGYVATALEELLSASDFYGRDRILEPSEDLSGSELKQISDILGRAYESIRLVKHDFFDVEGYTARIVSAGTQYSEAFAGSGEFAAIMLVHSIAEAPNGSLILLDEPETSLHPAAQSALMSFLANASVRKRLQVIISTHSPTIIQDLGPGSIRVLELDLGGSVVRLVPGDPSPREAFHRIGVDITPRTVLVEDRLARELVRKAARTRGVSFLENLDVRYLPGGASTLLTRVVPALPHIGSPALILLDGDQRPENVIPPSSEMAADDLEMNLNTLGISMKDLLRNGGNDTDRREEADRRAREVLDFCRDSLKYLPGQSPEELLCEMTNSATPRNSEYAKKYWEERTHQVLGRLPEESVTSDEIFHEQITALAAVPDDHADIRAITDVLSHALEGATH